ncbi:MAG: hypothetical protein J6Y20_11470 [Lachnospiraceae bacterium]|nr:hypothetical protein [Lachnospiraceae bacterium]
MPKKILCNKCGREFDIWDEQESFSIYKRLGYGTKFDGDNLKLNICCDCMEKLIDECVITPVEIPED